MARVVFVNSNECEDRNIAYQAIADMLMHEYQLQVETDTGTALLAFHKGSFFVQALGPLLEINDNGGVIPDENKSMDYAFLKARYDYREPKLKNLWRELPALVICDYLNQQIKLSESPNDKG